MKKYALFFGLVLLFAGCQYEDDFEPDQTDGFGTEIEDENGGNQTTEGEEGSLTLYRINANEIDRIKDYPVPTHLVQYQQDYARHFEMWNFVTRLLPLDARTKIVEFEVFHGGGDLLGYVVPIDDQDLSRWRFALAIDAAQDLNTIDFKDLFTFVTIHEYAHVLTLNDTQVTVGGDEWSCNQFFTGEGCSKANAYINRLYELGWADIIDDHDPDRPEETYNRYPDRFVSDYAATNPGEDIAEVFSFFVTQAERPNGNKIADQKIQLMYEFPELVEMRNRIRANGDVRALKAGSLGTLASFKGFRIGHPSHSHNTKAAASNHHH